ncbi:MAG: stage III sporulation protein AB [Ruminiclostridium sp.]|nr:stage III sporulation protein AB [Ruminiclostridium sp.]
MICTAAGAVFSSVLKARCRQLRLVVALVGDMSARIRYSAVPLTTLIAELSGGAAYTESAFLKRVAAGISQGQPVQEAWVKAARTAPFFSESDRDMLAETGARLGETDTDGQTAMLAFSAEMLGRSLEAAEADCTRRSGALMKVFMLCGLGAGIIII